MSARLYNKGTELDFWICMMLLLVSHCTEVLVVCVGIGIGVGDGPVWVGHGVDRVWVLGDGEGAAGWSEWVSSSVRSCEACSCCSDGKF